MFKPLPVQRLSYHSDIEVPLPYMERCLLTYVLSPCPEPILKKNNPWSFFFFWEPLGRACCARQRERRRLSIRTERKSRRFRCALQPCVSAPLLYTLPSELTFVTYGCHHALYTHVRVTLPCYHRRWLNGCICLSCVRPTSTIASSSNSPILAYFLSPRQSTTAPRVRFARLCRGANLHESETKRKQDEHEHGSESESKPMTSGNRCVPPLFVFYIRFIFHSA